MENVEELCDHLCILKQGHSLFAGSLLDLKKQYGKVKLRLRTDYPLDALAALEGVEEATAFRDEYMITLQDERYAKAIFDIVSNGQFIEKFSLDYLSLDEIFKHKVGGTHV